MEEPAYLVLREMVPAVGDNSRGQDVQVEGEAGYDAWVFDVGAEGVDAAEIGDIDDGHHDASGGQDAQVLQTPGAARRVPLEHGRTSDTGQMLEDGEAAPPS
jgi:hypothetical protein